MNSRYRMVQLYKKLLIRNHLESSPIFILGSLECDFQNLDKCNWKNVDGDDADWLVHSGETPTSGTGPNGGFKQGKTWISY